jgi:hypothetical protein
MISRIALPVVAALIVAGCGEAPGAGETLLEAEQADGTPANAEVAPAYGVTVDTQVVRLPEVEPDPGRP